MAVIELEERVAEALRVQANVRDLPLNVFLQRIAECATPLNAKPVLALTEMEQSLDEVTADSPVLPDSFARTEIYADHD